MSRWDEQFKQHPIRATLEEIRELCDMSPDEPDEQNVIERRRLAKVIDACTESLANIDPELAPFAQLDSLNNALRQPNIWNHVTNYKSNLNTPHLVTINDQLSSQLPQLALILAIAKRSERVTPIKGIEKLLDEFAASVTEKQRELADNYESLKQEVTGSKQRLTELDALIEKRREEINAQINAWQQQFSEAQERRSTEYNEWRNKIEHETREVVDEAISENNEKFAQESKMFIEKINSLLEDSVKKHEEILALYELTVGDSVAAGYLKNAEDEKTQANLWRWISIVFISITSAWLLFVWGYAAHVGATNIGWKQIVMSAVLTGVLLYGAAYSSQQSTRHRNNEKRVRWFALEVKAIDPFINSLGEEDRSQLKKLLSERLFGQSPGGGSGEPGVFDEHAFKMVIKGITDILSKLSKTGG